MKMIDRRRKALVRAHLLLRGSGGTAARKGTVSSSDLKFIMAAPEVVERVQQELSRLGFKIIGASPVQVTVEAAKPRFEDVFGAKIARSSSRTKASISRGREPRAVAASWKWQAPPRIPSDLAGDVEQVVFPERLQLH
jgi:hypothetical protein